MGNLFDASGRSLEAGKLQLNIDKLKSNPAAKVAIVGGGLKVEGILSGDFSFGVGSEYTSLFDVGQIDDLSQVVNRVTTVANSFKSRTGLGSIPQLRLKSPGLTTKVFQGTKNPSFGIDIILVNLREDDDIMKTVKDLARMSLPTISQVTKVGVGVYKAPLGYNSEVISNRSTGPVAVSIGRWFRAMHQIVEDVSFSFSRVGSDEKGTPLFATATIRFCPTVDIGISEFLDYFKV